MRPILPLLPFTLFLSGLSHAQTAPALTPAGCQFRATLPELPDHQLSCANLSVPARHEQPGGPKYQLHVAVYRFTGSGKQSDPVVVLNGGPGQRTASLAAALPAFAPLAAQRDLILFDQRGVGASTPALNCALPPEYLKIESAIDSNDESRALLQKTMQDCLKGHAAQGVDLASFNTMQSADDVWTLARALGGQVNLFSASYGTRLAQEVMRRHPEVLRSVILDAPVNTNANYLQNRGRTIDQAYRLALKRCEADKDCNAAFPDLAARVEAFAGRINAEPLKVEVDLPDGKKTVPVNAAALGGMTTLLLYGTGATPMLPWFLDAILKGDTTDLKNIIPATLTALEMNELGMQFAFGCNEVTPFAKPSDLEYGPGQPSALLKSMNDPATYGMYSRVCEGLPFKAVPASTRDAVKSSVPTLILTGELDPVTPPMYAKTIAESLSRAQMVTFVDGAHGQLGMPCGMQLMTDFLKNPANKVDAACAAVIRPFAVPKQ